MAPRLPEFAFYVSSATTCRHRCMTDPEIKIFVALGVPAIQGRSLEQIDDIRNSAACPDCYFFDGPIRFKPDVHHSTLKRARTRLIRIQGGGGQGKRSYRAWAGRLNSTTLSAAPPSLGLPAGLSGLGVPAWSPARTAGVDV